MPTPTKNTNPWVLLDFFNGLVRSWLKLPRGAQPLTSVMRHSKYQEIPQACHDPWAATYPDTDKISNRNAQS